MDHSLPIGSTLHTPGDCNIIFFTYRMTPYTKKTQLLIRTGADTFWQFTDGFGVKSSKNTVVF